MTIRYGEPIRFDVVADPDRDQQQAASAEIFSHVREMYDGLAHDGRRSVIKMLREGRSSPQHPSYS